jgi:vacuolar-type H+-ATPase subunit H
VDQAKTTAQRLVSEAQDRATEQVHSRLDAQKHQAAESLSGVAESLRATGRQMRGQPIAGASGYVEQAADRVEDLAYFLRESEVGEIVDYVEDFARRQPGLFLGGAFALGVLGARFLKSSRQNLVHRGVRERWSTDQLTRRMEDPERDAVGRPGAHGYAPAPERASSEHKAAGPREG